MNFINLAVGDVMTEIGGQLASKFIGSILSDDNRFTNLLSNLSSSNRLTIEDLNLSREEEIALLDIQEQAQNKGLETVEIEVSGTRFIMNTADSTLVPKYS